MADQTILTFEAFRRLTGAQPGEIEELVAHGILRQTEPGQIGLVAGVGAYINHLKARARNATLSSAAIAARDARAEASELALRVARRDLIADGEAEAALDYLASVIVGEATGLPARATRDLRARAAMDAALRSALTAISNDLSKA